MLGHMPEQGLLSPSPQLPTGAGTAETRASPAASPLQLSQPHAPSLPLSLTSGWPGLARMGAAAAGDGFCGCPELPI